MAFTSRCPVVSRGALVSKHGSVARRPVVAGLALARQELACKAAGKEVPGDTAAAQVALRGCLAALAAAALVAGTPLEAAAVSGGGGISTPLSGEDFSGQDLRKKSYTKAVLRKTNFSKANLAGVSLFGCLAEGADFSGADLTNADLESGNFEGADFTNANLTGSFVNNAQFDKATKFENTDWTDVVLRKDMQQFLCSRASGTNPTTGVDTKESLVCPN